GEIVRREEVAEGAVVDDRSRRGGGHERPGRAARGGARGPGGEEGSGHPRPTISGARAPAHGARRGGSEKRDVSWAPDRFQGAESGPDARRGGSEKRDVSSDTSQRGATDPTQRVHGVGAPGARSIPGGRA